MKLVTHYFSILYLGTMDWCVVLLVIGKVALDDVVGRPLSVCPLRTLFADRRLTLLLEAFDGAHCEYPRAYLSLLPSNPLW